MAASPSGCQWLVRSSQCGLTLPERSADCVADAVRGKPRCRGDRGQDVPRHALEQGIGGVLDDHPTAVIGDDEGACGAVRCRAGQDHGHDVAAVRIRRRPQERVDGRTMPILARAADDPDDTVLDDQVPVGWRDEDAPIAQRFAIDRVSDTHRAATLEDLG